MEENESDCKLLYDSTNFKVLAGLRAGVGLISFLACLGVVVLILVFKKYRHFFSQRLVLNVAVAAMIHSFSYTTARVNYYTVREIEDPYCYFAGPFNYYSGVVELLSILLTAVNIFSVGMCRRNISIGKCEVVYYVTTFSLPLLWFWVPIQLHAYGTNGGWCEIKNLDKKCEPFTMATYIQLGIWFVPLYSSMGLTLFMLLAVAVKYCYTAHRWKDASEDGAATNRLIRDQLRTLVRYPIIYLLLSSTSLLTQIYRAISPNSSGVVLDYFRVLTSPLRGGFIALAFALDKETRNRLTVASCRAACKDCVKKEPRIEALESITLYSEQEESFEESKHGSYGSYRRFK